MFAKKTNVVSKDGNNAVPKKQEGIVTMAKQPEAKASVKPATNVKGTGTPASATPMAKDTKLAVYVNPAAMSPDIGRQVVLNYGAARAEGISLKEQLDANQKKTNGQLKLLTEAFVKAAINDKRINLDPKNVKSDKAEDLRELRQQLEVAIGIRTVVTNTDGTRKFEYADWAKSVFPTAQEKQENEALWQQKENFRTNFATQFKKCIGAASTIYTDNIKLSEDTNGNLMISGPKVKERFNVESVTLNEKRDMLVKGDDGANRRVKLAKIPSFTELDRMASEKAGKVLKTKTDSRAQKTTVPTDPQMISMVKSMTVTIGLMKNFSDELADEFQNLADAIDKALEQNTGLEETRAEAAADEAAQAAT